MARITARERPIAARSRVMVPIVVSKTRMARKIAIKPRVKMSQDCISDLHPDGPPKPKNSGDQQDEPDEDHAPAQRLGVKGTDVLRTREDEVSRERDRQQPQDPC